MKNTVYEADVQTGEVKKEQIIHICVPQNIGKHMCIDEKMIEKNTLPSFQTKKQEK